MKTMKAEKTNFPQDLVSSMSVHGNNTEQSSPWMLVCTQFLHTDSPFSINWEHSRRHQVVK